jgi:hypothetical protein
MSVKTARLDDIKEGEYETQFGRIEVDKTDYGYKITIYINERALGRNIAKQIASSLVGPYLKKEELA